MYKLIACDLDETLIGEDKHVSLKNREAIRKAQSQGVKFAIATGRGYRTVQDTLLELGLHDLLDEYVISFNGGVITENKNNRVLTFNGITFQQGKALFEFGLKYDVCMHIYTENDVYIYNFHPEEKAYLKGRINNCIELIQPSIDFLKDIPLVKILFQNSNKQYLEKIHQDILPLVEDQFDISYSSNRYIEFNQQGVNKGSALLHLADLLEIPHSQTMSIGDNTNDLTMIRAAQLGISVQNGTPDIKAEANYIAPENFQEDAVAAVIEKFILTEL
ncbi:Cof-type HAD-IIB family hydrolase [Carnobacterium gallinarum]|uniref:Cof-type HAD-IIB family hydrolase n=1 Tax=Carnobacterium gallinarum TaxID=2749 RepID=UPI000557C9DF|nr:Cof-type HAD-IIB family hydrolase [Carnobacterium gallinarum]